MLVKDEECKEIILEKPKKNDFSKSLTMKLLKTSVGRTNKALLPKKIKKEKSD